MLELTDLRKRYGDVVALDGISLDVAPGRISGFVGPNGAGKTTAMRIVLGVLSPDAGSVRWEGAELDETSRRRIGYMPEERGLYPKMAVGRQLSYFAELHGLEADEANASAERWMERLGVSGRAGDAVEELSLGNQQRVQLAAALVHEPDLLVLDEPFSGLDPVGVEVLAEVLVTEARERGLPVIFSSHQLELVERICDSVAIVNGGRIVASGDVEELREARSENHWEAVVEGRGDDWLGDLDGAKALGDGVFELAPGTDHQKLLDRARAAGPVTRFGLRRPTLTDLFREVVADVPVGGGGRLSSRRAIRLTALREIRERVRSRAFRASIAIQVLIILAIVVISAVSGENDEQSYEVGAVGPDAVRIVESLADREIQGITVEETEPGDAEEARSKVADGDLDAALVDGTLVVGPKTDDELKTLVGEAAGRAATAQTLADVGVSNSDIAKALDPPQLPSEEVGTDRESANGIAFIGSLLLYLGILGFGYIVTSAIVEEKTSRVVELILSTIRPSQLLAGKVIGIGLLGLLQLLVTAGVGVGAALASGQVDLPSSTPQTVALVLVYFILGYALYACAFAVAGAIVSRQEDVGSVTTPLTIVLVAGYLASFSITDDPSGTLATVCTFLPPIAPLVVPARAAVGGLPVGELIVSVVLMVAFTLGLVWVASRVYERAVLRVGAPMKLIEGLKLARR